MVLTKLLTLHEERLASLLADQDDRHDLAGTSTLKSTRYLPKSLSSRPATGLGRVVQHCDLTVDSRDQTVTGPYGLVAIVDELG
jgi:hypothetical protein